jgi:hypothetical protein
MALGCFENHVGHNVDAFWAINRAEFCSPLFAGGHATHQTRASMQGHKLTPQVGLPHVRVILANVWTNLLPLPNTA